MKTNELITKIRSVMHMVAPPARELLEQAAEALEECRMHSAECRMKWIPVTERLPNLVPCDAGTAYSEAVNVLTDGRKVLTAVWDGHTFLCDADYWEAWDEKITHWMPLPTPPKEG